MRPLLGLPPALPTGLPAALLALALAPGCGGNPLSQPWQLDRLRVLAVQAEPAEPRPGDLVQLEALYYLPAWKTLELSVWFACLPEQADEFGCEVDPAALDALEGVDPEALTPEEQAALLEQLLDAGLIGVEPWFSPTWVAPADALDGLDEAARLEGVSAVINISAVPTGATGEDEVEIAYKRLPISEATTPNHNPAITGFTVGGEVVAPGATVACGWGDVLELEPVLGEDTLETYTYRASDGTEEERVEEPYVTWYTEAGAFDQPYSLYPQTAVQWTAPASATDRHGDAADAAGQDSVRVIAVIRDRRGGMGWAELVFTPGA